MRATASSHVVTDRPFKIVPVKEDCGSLLEHGNYEIDEFVRGPNHFVTVLLVAAD